MAKRTLWSEKFVLTLLLVETLERSARETHSHSGRLPCLGIGIVMRGNENLRDCPAAQCVSPTNKVPQRSCVHASLNSRASSSLTLAVQ